MARRLRLTSSLLTQSIFLIATMFECEAILSSLSFVILGTTMFVSAAPVKAQHYDPWFNAGDLTFELERYWPHEPQSVTQADYQTDTRVALRSDARFVTPSYPAIAQNPAPKDPTGDSGLPVIPPPPNQPSAPAIIPPQQSQTNEPTPAPHPNSQDLPAPMPNPTIEPAPANQPNSAPAQAQQAAPPAQQAAPSLSGELKKVEAEEKKKEKPAIPDFAKAILIAQNEGDLTFKPGVRIQPRYMFDSGNDNNDFFIRRFRLKGSGSAYGLAKYGVELKIDNEGRFGVSPAARAENAWLDFPVVDDYAYLRAGLYDLPFSRDALTSDSKLLFMDRTLIKEQLTAVGMADNTYGVMLHGRPDGGHFEYAFGIFDSDQFERFGTTGLRESDELMPAGRVVWSLWDPMTPLDGYADYMESYIGKGERFEIGTNFAHLGDAIDGAITQDLTAWGVDLFANSGHFTFQTEYDRIIEDIAGAANLYADGWYVQWGYLFDICNPCTEFVVRYEELDPFVGEDLNWWRIGFNFYIREHNLKIQTDYNIRSHNTLAAPLPGGLGFFDDNVFEVQLQLDF